MNICSKEGLLIRKLENKDNDFELIRKWLSNKNVYDYYGDSGEKEFEYIKQKYGNKLNNDEVYPCIIEFYGIPIGYIQFYKVGDTNYDLTIEQLNLICEDKDNTFAIDLFIGEDEYRDKGLGTKILKLLIESLLDFYKADVIVIDPKTNNSRAIKCYKNCGFEEKFIAKQREEKDGIKYDNIIMVIKKR